MWHVAERFHAFTLLDVKLGTGRTHQVGSITLAYVNHSLFLPFFLSSFLTLPGRFNHARFCHVNRSLPLLSVGSTTLAFVNHYLPCYSLVP
jgi:hypothetical protein